jgi:hypothetical protein
MLEFALTAVVVFTLIFGVMYLALALYTYEVLNQYARDASRYAIVHGNGCVKATDGSPCTIGTAGDSGPGGNASTTTGNAGYALYQYLTGSSNYPGSESYPGISAGHLEVVAAYAKSAGEGACSVTTNCNGSGDQVTVTVSYPYLYAIPFIRSRSFTMNAVSVMTISQ